MKQLIIFFGFISLSFQSYSQITLEHSFTASSLNEVIRWFASNTKGLMYYEMIDTVSNQVRIYNEDYSLYKIVTLPRPIGNICYINYIGEQRVNTDNLIEFFAIYEKYPRPRQIVLYNENAAVIKDFGTKVGYWPEIITSKSGTSKLLLYYSTPTNHQATDVYSLPNLSPNNILAFNDINTSSAFPNPSKTIINLPYLLVKGESTTMSIYKSNGQLIEKKNIGPAFDKIQLNVSSYPSGSYIYEYNGISKKFLVD